MRKTSTFFLGLVFLIFLVISTNSEPRFSETNTQEKNAQLLTSWLVTLYQQGEFSGVVLYAEKGQIKYQQSLGTADIHGKKPLSLDSSFNLASVSKQFTATAIMLLKQDGKLEYDQTVQTYLTEFPYGNITVRHLLNHTSGLTDYIKLAKKYWDRSKIFTNDDMLALFAKYKPELEFKPGSAFAYSNTGYVVLSEIVERVSGSTFESFLSQRIFQPLNMKNSRVFNLLSKDKTFETRVFGKKGNKLNDLIILDGVTGDGAVYASANDLLRWDQAIYQNKLIKKELQDEAFKPVTFVNGEKSYYGFGWSLSKNKDYVIHAGAWVGFSTVILRNFVNKSVTIILTNNSNMKYLKTISESLGKIFGS
ncbi:MAG: beta-lactamase family protein [Candidatus Marinimicrobia bacterium]|nr:beta-lactamase family protein [Candidatus Neomarinimicrobiota bacterium]